MGSAPTGWYVVAQTDELRGDAPHAVRLAGRDLVLFRGARGLVATDAHCPHLGAHLGRGRVVDGTLECPFHGFRFGEQGQCVATGLGARPPRTARLRTHPTAEVAGLVAVWWDEAGDPPTWTPPVVDTAGWTPVRVHTLQFRGDLRAVAENSVDVAHFAWVHGYLDVEARGPLVIDGPSLRASYAFTRPRRTFAVMDAPRAEFTLHQHGLGYALVEANVPAYGIATRQWVLPRPLGGDEVSLRLAISLRYLERSSRIHRLLGLVPPRWLTERIAAAAITEFVRDVRQDLPMWEGRAWVEHPALCGDDGPIGTYRQWTRQFFRGGATKVPPPTPT